MRHSNQKFGFSEASTSLGLALAVFSSVITSHAAAVAIEIVAASHGASCAEAKANLRNLVAKGPNAYSFEQFQTRQFETGPAATKYCRAVHASAARVPEITEAALFPLPTESVLSYHYPCSTIEVGGQVVFGVGWSNVASCF